MDAALNWLWQGAAVAIVTALLLRLLESSRSQLRSIVCWTGLIALLLLPVVTATSVPPAVPAEGTEVARGTEVLLSLPAAWWTSRVAVLAICVLWTFGFGARVAGSVVSMHRTKKRAGVFPRALESRLRCWERVRAGGRRARLVVSDRVRVAAVLGGRAPMIAITPALVDRLSADELDRVVIHEWAHVQRRDDLARAVVLAIRSVAGWHPAAWWLTGRLQAEWETACDELAVTVTGSPKAYAACLLRIAGMPVGAGADPLLATGALSSPLLPVRIRRIVTPHRPASRGRSTVGAACCAAVLAIAMNVGTMPAIGIAVAEPPRLLRALADSVGVQDATVLRPATAKPVAAPRGARVSGMRTVDPAATAVESRTPSLESRAPNPDSRIPIPESAIATRCGAGRQSCDPPTAKADGASSPAASNPESSALQATAHPWHALSTVVPARVAATTAPPSSDSAGAPWMAAADAGRAVGTSAKSAGVATSGFFSRVSRRIANSF